MSINYHCAGAYGNWLPSESLTAKRDIRIVEFRKYISVHVSGQKRIRGT
jgi:hypothetical protein